MKREGKPKQQYAQQWFIAFLSLHAFSYIHRTEKRKKNKEEEEEEKKKRRRFTILGAKA